MQIFALLFMRFFPVILIGGLIISVAHYVWMVFDVVDTLMLKYLSVGFLGASGLYAKITFFSLIFAPIIVCLKSILVKETALLRADYMLVGLLCYFTFYLIMISILAFYAIVSLALLQSPFLLMILLVSPLLIGLIIVVYYSAIVFLASWVECIGTMKAIMLSSFTLFSIMAIYFGDVIQIPLYQT